MHAGKRKDALAAETVESTAKESCAVSWLRCRQQPDRSVWRESDAEVSCPMTTHLALVGEQPMPVLLIDRHLRPEHTVLVCTARRARSRWRSGCNG